MRPYPTEFSEGPLERLKSPIAELGQLADAGFEVTVGVRRQDMPAIARIAGQAAVREYCPKDMEVRFGDGAKAAHWLQTKGRGLFLLRPIANEADVAGYGWTGREANEHLPDCETTFALRLSQEVSGKGLGVPFTNAILVGARTQYGARRVGLETWGSNTPAVRTYVKAGAELVTARDSHRPTREHGPQIVRGQRHDARLFMQFPHTFQ